MNSALERRIITIIIIDGKLLIKLLMVNYWLLMAPKPTKIGRLGSADWPEKRGSWPQHIPIPPFNGSAPQNTIILKHIVWKTPNFH